MPSPRGEAETIGNRAVWSVRDLNDADMDRVLALSGEGLSIREIAEETGIPKSTVARLKKKAEASGATFAVAAE